MSTSVTLPTARNPISARLGLGAAVLAATLAAVPAQAAIVTYSFPTPLSVPNTFNGLYVNLATGISGVTGASTPGWDLNPYNNGTTLSFFWSASPSQASGVAATTSGPYLDLAPGSTISSASTFAQVTSGTATAQFQTIGTHTLGLRFYNEITSTVNYGYIVLQVAGTNGFPVSISSWTFDNTGAAITTPAAIPEPGTYAMLGLGGLLVAGLARRRARHQG